MPKVRSGYVFDEDGKWFARVTYTDATGKRRNIKRRAENKTAAKELKKDLLRQIDEGEFEEIDRKNDLLSDYLAQWLESVVKQRVSARTHSDYRVLVEKYIKPHIGNKKVGSLKPYDVHLLYEKLQKNGLSSRSVRYCHSILSSALKQAVRWGLLKTNPAQAVELPKIGRKEMKALSPEEARRFIAAAAEDRFGLLFAVMLATGMRPGEILALQWQDIDFAENRLRVHRSLKTIRGKYWSFGEPKTPGSRRTIPLPAVLLRALADYRSAQQEEIAKAPGDWADYDLVFSTEKGTPVELRNLVLRHFKPTLKRAGLDESVRLYDLRHTHATLLLAAEQNPKVVSERLGHASITLTLDTYSHVLPTRQVEATRQVEKLLFGKVKKKRKSG